MKWMSKIKIWLKLKKRAKRETACKQYNDCSICPYVNDCGTDAILNAIINK